MKLFHVLSDKRQDLFCVPAQSGVLHVPNLVPDRLSNVVVGHLI